MKKLIFILFTSLILFSCEYKIDPVFKRKHKLRKFNVYTETGQYSHGSFFLVAGSFSTQTYEKCTVKFAWLDNDSAYVLSEVSYNKIKIHTDSTIVEPYITFQYDKDEKFSSNPKNHINEILDWKIYYVIVHCKEEDFPMNVNINQL